MVKESRVKSQKMGFKANSNMYGCPLCGVGRAEVGNSYSAQTDFPGSRSRAEKPWRRVSVRWPTEGMRISDLEFGIWNLEFTNPQFQIPNPKFNRRVFRHRAAPREMCDEGVAGRSTIDSSTDAVWLGITSFRSHFFFYNS
jgi:hypothetical protein